jgi:hypothetical protein
MNAAADHRHDVAAADGVYGGRSEELSADVPARPDTRRLVSRLGLIQFARADSSREYGIRRDADEGSGRGRPGRPSCGSPCPTPRGDLRSRERVEGVLVDVAAARIVVAGERLYCLDRVEDIADVWGFGDAV